MKYLIVGLGNIGDEYRGTRHNIGFRILDAFAEASNISFTTERYGDVAHMRLKNKQLTLLKPSTYMNLSGNAVRYWKEKEGIDVDHILILVDDIALPFGAIRIKSGGSDAGHNGLKNIAQMLAHRLIRVCVSVSEMIFREGARSIMCSVSLRLTSGSSFLLELMWLARR